MARRPQLAAPTDRRPHLGPAVGVVATSNARSPGALARGDDGERPLRRTGARRVQHVAPSRGPRPRALPRAGSCPCPSSPARATSAPLPASARRHCERSHAELAVAPHDRRRRRRRRALWQLGRRRLDLERRSWRRIASCRRRSSGPGSTPISLDQDPPRVAVCLERLRLAAAAVQRQHPLAVEALAQRMLGDERLDLRRRPRVAPGGRGRRRSPARPPQRAAPRGDGSRRRRTARRPRRPAAGPRQSASASRAASAGSPAAAARPASRAAARSAATSTRRGRCAARSRARA